MQELKKQPLKLGPLNSPLHDSLQEWCNSRTNIHGKELFNKTLNEIHERISRNSSSKKARNLSRSSERTKQVCSRKLQSALSRLSKDKENRKASKKVYRTQDKPRPKRIDKKAYQT